MEKVNLPVHQHPLYQVGGNEILGNTGVLHLCDGCYGEGHLDSGYRCSQCPMFYLHKKCGESSSKINHPSHPEHPLHLLTGSECGGKKCHLCGISLELLCYHCSICDFTLDTGCAISPPRLTIEQPKAHKHTLTFMTAYNRYRVTCHVCHEQRRRNKYFYSCLHCDLFFHIECVFLSPEINHPSHPRHLLKLLKGRSSMNSSYCCTLCGLNIRRPNFYHCSICNFTVDMRCARNPPSLALVSPKTHKHELTCMPRRICFTCNACGRQGDQSPYVCIQCNFMIHGSCIDLPRVIWINRHDHRISHTYNLDIGNLDVKCGVCHQTIDPSYGAYSCLKCRSFSVHSRCATKRYIWDGRDLEGEPEETEDVAPFKRIGNNLIKHFSHEEHDMEFIEEESVERGTITCKACTKPIDAKSFYKCMQCDFFLHERCANLPCKIRSVLFPEKLTLVGGASHFHEAFRCSPCRRYCSGFRYKSGPYEHIADSHCISTKEILKREAHPHSLHFSTGLFEDCSSCNKKGTFGFKCLKGNCAFYLHMHCAVLPETVNHKSDDHPLRLCYHEYGNGKYWCDICEKEVDFYKQYYTCDTCGTTCHINCVLGDLLGSISPGSIITHTEYNHGKPLEYEFQVVSNTGINRPFCSVCHFRCLFSLVLKTHDGFGCYICSSACLRGFMLN